MPNNYPYDSWYWNDWFASTAMLSITARGVWHELLGRMYLDDRNYFIEGTIEELARCIGCGADEFTTAIAEIKNREVGDVTSRHDNVTKVFRIECRRFKKEYFKRKNAAERKRRQREFEKGHGDVTDSCFTFSDFWDCYDKKVEKAKCERIYAKIPEAKRTAIKESLPDYVKATPDKRFRKNPQTWLNNSCWDDEIVMPGTAGNPKKTQNAPNWSANEKDDDVNSIF
jgi:hypothetical protein